MFNYYPRNIKFRESDPDELNAFDDNLLDSLANSGEIDENIAKNPEGHKKEIVDIYHRQFEGLIKDEKTSFSNYVWTIASMLTNFMPDYPPENMTAENIHFDPLSAFKAFCAARMNPKILIKDKEDLAKVQPAARKYYSDLMDSYIKNGGDFEAIRLMLTKMELEATKTPYHEKEELCIVDLQQKAAEISTPYDKIFDTATQIAKLQQESRKTNDPDKQYEIDDKITDLKDSLKDMTKDIDPKMLQTMAAEKKQRLGIEQEIEYEHSGKSKDNNDIAFNTELHNKPSYNGANMVEFMANNKIKQQEGQKEM